MLTVRIKTVSALVDKESENLGPTNRILLASCVSPFIRNPLGETRIRRSFQLIEMKTYIVGALTRALSNIWASFSVSGREQSSFLYVVFWRADNPSANILRMFSISSGVNLAVVVVPTSLLRAGGSEQIRCGVPVLGCTWCRPQLSPFGLCLSQQQQHHLGAWAKTSSPLHHPQMPLLIWSRKYHQSLLWPLFQFLRFWLWERQLPCLWG